MVNKPILNSDGDIFHGRNPMNRFFTLVLLFLSTATKANGFDFFSHDANNPNALVVFHYKAGDIKEISSVSLNFFAVDDCQEQLLGYYRTTRDGTEHFLINPSEWFTLQNDKTYQIASGILPYETINKIHSLLISFRAKPKEFPRFLSGCSDQGSKCCISIQCSNEAGICLPKYPITSQSFIFFSDYD
jgi:hypothetical protein